MAEYKKDEKLQAFYNRFLKELQARPRNSVCADCGERNPRFVSIKLGVFVCNRCYGVHRAIGAHVTRTKCIGLDAWLPEEIALLRDVGNERAAVYWEAKAPADRARPTPDSPEPVLEKWIRDKYERRLFCDPQVPQPQPGPYEDLLAPPPPKKANAAAPKANQSPKQAQALPSSPPSSIAAPGVGAFAPQQDQVPAAVDLSGWADFESAFATSCAQPAVSPAPVTAAVWPATAFPSLMDTGTAQSGGGSGTGGDAKLDDWASELAWPAPSVGPSASGQS